MRRLEIRAYVPDIPAAFLRVFFETATENLAHARVELCGKTSKVRIAPDHRCHGVGDVLAFEELPAREHLIEHDAKRKDVGPFVNGLPARLLRAHVGGRPQNDPDLGGVRAQSGGVRKLRIRRLAR